MKNTVFSNNADTSRQSSGIDASAIFPPEKEYPLLKAVNEALLHLLSAADQETALRNACEIVGNAIQCEGVAFFKFGAIQEEKAALHSLFCLAKTENHWSRWTDFTLELPLEDERTRTNYYKVKDEGYISITSRTQNGPNLTAILEQIGVGSYFSSRIVLDGQVWGVGTFASYSTSLDWAETNISILLPFIQTVGNFIARREAQEALKEQHDYFKQVIDVCPNPIFAKNRQGILTMVNRAMATYHQFQPEDIIGRHIREFLPQKEEEIKALEEDAVIFDTGQPVIESLRQITTLMGPCYMQLSKLPLVNGKGEITEVVSVLTDLTALKNAERALEKQRDYLRKILDLNPTLIFAKDLQGRYNLANQAIASSIYGISPPEMIGKTDLEITNHPEEAQLVIQADQEVLQSRQTQFYPLVKTTDHKGEKHYLQATLVPLLSESGECEEIFGVGVDITSLKKTESYLLKEKHFSESITTLIPDWILILNPSDEKVIYHNIANQILGYDINSISNIYNFFGNHLHPDDVNTIAEFVKRIQESNDQEVLEKHFRLQHKDGRWLHFYERARVFSRHADGSVKEFLALIQDVTAQVSTQQAIEKSELRYRNFINYSQEGIYYMSCGKPISIHLDFEEMTRLFYENAFVEECNDSFAKMYGGTMEQLIGMKAVHFHGGEHFEENVQSFRNLIQRGFQVANIETIEPDINGNIKYFLNSAVGIIEKEHLIGFWGTQLDITERKQTQQREQSRSHILELLSKGASLSAILEAIVEGVEQQEPGMISSILLLDKEEKRLWVATAPRLPDFYNEAINGREIGLGAGSCGTAAFTGERVIVEDIQTHPYWKDYKELAAQAELQSCWSEPIKDSTGKVLGSFAIYHQQPSTPSAHDIEIIRQASDLASIVLHKFHTEEELKESEEKFHSMVRNISDVLTLLDENGKILFESSSLQQVLGFEEQELIGENFFDFIHPHDAPFMAREFKNTLTKKGNSTLVEFRFLNKAGSYTHLEAQSNNQLNNPAIKGIIVNSRDITERKQAEQALKESKGILKAIVNALPDLKFRVNKAGIFLDYYESEYENEPPIVPPSEFIGKKLHEVLPSFVAEAGMRSIHKAIQNKRIQTFEYVLPMEEAFYYYEGRVSPISVEEAIIGIRNISDRKRAQLSLQEKLRELDEKNKQLTQYIESNFQLENFAYIASHDLREPVRTVHSFAQLLKKRYWHQLDEDGKKCLDFIVYGSENMNRLIDDLLTYSRVSSEEHKVETLKISPLLEEVRNSLAQFIKEKDALIEFYELPAQIKANPTTIKQLFQNLFVNGIKFHHPDKTPVIQVSGIDYGTHWLFEVKDNGIGIPKDMNEKIFQLFKKIHYIKEQQGTGIGLAISKRIVEQHGGEIWVESSPENGSSFYFTLKK